MFQESGFFETATYLTVFWFLAPAAVLHAFVRWRRGEGGGAVLFAFCSSPRCSPWGWSGGTGTSRNGHGPFLRVSLRAGLGALAASCG